MKFPDEKPKEEAGEPDYSHLSEDDAWVVKYVLACREESKLAKWNRIQQTRENWDVYWLRHDFSHKTEGQSQEVLSMQPMAVETTAAFFQQALVDLGDDWYSAEAANPQNDVFLKIDAETVKSIQKMQFRKAEFIKHVAHGLKSGLMGGNIITKVHGDFYDVPKYVATPEKNILGVKVRKAKLERVQKKAWKTRFDIISQFNYYPDPTPTNHKRLYEIEDMWMDYHELCALSQGDDAIYDEEIVELLQGTSDGDAEGKFDEQRRTNQNTTMTRSSRGRIKVTELWGTILDENGEVLHENCVVTIANDRFVLRKPTPNPLWHQESPYVVANLLDIPDAVWPKALMDSPTKHNMAATEVYNLILDGAMKAVNNIGMIRQDWLEDASQVAGGVQPGTNLLVNAQCPPGAKVMEMVQSGTVPPESMQMLQTIYQEFNRDALTSDIRSGMQAGGDVSATQVVETNHTINSVFKGLAANVEEQWIQKLLHKQWITSMQYSDLMDEDELRAVLSPDRAAKFLNMTPEERFAETVQGIKFRVNGITLTLQRKQDFKQYMTLMQTVASSPTLNEEFVKKYSYGALLKQMMKTLGVDTEAIELSMAEQEVMMPAWQRDQLKAQAKQQQTAAAPGNPAAQGTDAPAEPNTMSQVPQPTSGSQQDQMGSAAGTAPQPAQGAP